MRPVSAATLPRERVHGKDKGQWREANRRHQFQSAILSGVMPTCPPVVKDGPGPSSVRAQTPNKFQYKRDHAFLLLFVFRS